MDLNEIKSKFRHKAKADITDLDLVLNAVPFLVREIEKMEKQQGESEKRIEHLSSLMKKRPPLEKKGSKGGLQWKASVDEDKNRLYIQIAGKVDYQSAKLASNHVITVLVNLRENFDVVNDISEIEPGYNKKSLFHINKMVFSMNETGVRRIISVTKPESAGVSAIVVNRSKEDGFQTGSAGSVEEAEGMLDSAESFLKA